MTPRTFPFEFEPIYAAAALPFGVTPRTAAVVLDNRTFSARFGAWSVRTPVENLAGAEATGPYSPLKTIGPAHLSFADRGLTFATNRRRGACIRFRDPVAGLVPSSALRHPALTVTVADVDGLCRAVEELTS